MSQSLPRITARVDEDTQQLLSQAAGLLGLPSINAFVLSAAVEKAREVIEQEQRLQLSKADAEALISALERPVQVHPKLAAAAKRYQAQST